MGTVEAGACAGICLVASPWGHRLASAWQPQVLAAGDHRTTVTRTVEYHCLNCLDNTITREFDVSHLSMSCDECGEFGRFVNGNVLAKVNEFDDSPPEELDWDRLDRMEQFLVAERIVRKGHTLDDFEIERHDDEGDDAAADDSADGAVDDGSVGDDVAPADAAADDADRH